MTADIGIMAYARSAARIPVAIGMPNLRTFELHCAWDVDPNTANYNTKKIVRRAVRGIVKDHRLTKCGVDIEQEFTLLGS